MSIFAKVAEMSLEIAEPEIPTDVPETVGAAANVWLRIARRNMMKTSNRVVPAKIKRFVAVLGAELPTAKIDQARAGRSGGTKSSSASGTRTPTSSASRAPAFTLLGNPAFSEADHGLRQGAKPCKASTI